MFLLIDGIIELMNGSGPSIKICINRFSNINARSSFVKSIGLRYRGKLDDEC